MGIDGAKAVARLLSDTSILNYLMARQCHFKKVILNLLTLVFESFLVWELFLQSLFLCIYLFIYIICSTILLGWNDCNWRGFGKE